MNPDPTTATAVMASPANTCFLSRSGRRLAYDDTGGAGPLVVAVPALGDLRASYRFLVPRLVGAGARVVTLDLRGMGESDTGWDDYSAMAVGDDLIALLSRLDAGPAVLAGNSHGGGAAVWAAARAPELVRGLVLLGPFVRDARIGAGLKAMMKAALAPPWGRLRWLGFFGKEFAERPADFAAYRAKLSQNLREPGRMDSIRGMMWATKSPIEAILPRVPCPTVVGIGRKDPDFSDPGAEAREVATLLHGEARVIEGVGHYAQVEAPDRVAEIVLALLPRRVPDHH